MNTTNSRLSWFTHIDAILVAVLGTGSLALYVRTLAPGLSYGDSAEFQTIAYTLGIGHPTGYPIYILLTKIFTFLPVGEIAYRVNLFSAFSAVVTLVIVYLILRLLGTTYAPAIFGSLSISLVPLFWKFATVAEVYTPATACLAFNLFAVLNWRISGRLRWLFLAGLFGGLSLGIHTSLALAAPAIILYLGLNHQYQRKNLQEGWKVLSCALLGVATGIGIFILAFLYLDYRNAPAGYYNAVVVPSLSVWDMAAVNFDSPLERLSFLYFPPQFRGQFFAVPYAEAVLRLTAFAREYSLMLLIGLLGVIHMFIANRVSFPRTGEGLLFLTTAITSIGFAVTYDVYDYYVFYFPSVLILAVLAGFGLHGSLEYIMKKMRLPRAAQGAVVFVCVGILLLRAPGEFSSAWREQIPPGLDDRDRLGYHFPGVNKLKVEKIVIKLEDNAIVFTNWDRLYCYYYVAFVLQGRLEMDFQQIHPHGQEDDLVDSLITYIERNIDERPIYFTMYPYPLAERYKVSSAGPDLFRIKKK